MGPETAWEPLKYMLVLGDLTCGLLSAVWLCFVPPEFFGTYQRQPPAKLNWMSPRQMQQWQDWFSPETDADSGCAKAPFALVIAANWFSRSAPCFEASSSVFSVCFWIQEGTSPIRPVVGLVP